jgi:hypothetical protein
MEEAESMTLLDEVIFCIRVLEEILNFNFLLILDHALADRKAGISNPT